jgi:cation diffusion facilitator family transporter
MTRYKEIKLILIWLMVANVAVTVAKGIVGYLTGSLGMVADAFHSLTDSTNNVIGLVAIGMAGRPPDEDHPYGHAKYETLATIAVSGLLLFAAYNIIKGAIDRFQHPASPQVEVISFAVMFITIAINIAVATYEYQAGKRLNSDFLIADSMHTRSDIFVSLSVIVTLGFVRLGYPIVDPIISLVIGGFIAKAGFDIIKRSSSALTDKAVLDPEALCQVVLAIPGVKGCHSIRTRGTTDLVYVDLHVEVDPAMPTSQAHDLATSVEEMVIAGIPGVADVVVHIEPFGRGTAT